MTLRYGDRVQESITTPGTAAFNLGTAVTGYRTFSSITSIANGDTVDYVATDTTGAIWEIGTGTYTTGAPNTLVRTTVISNSSGNTSPINFTTNVNLVNSLTAERFSALGTMSTQNANAVAITGGTISASTIAATASIAPLSTTGAFTYGALSYSDTNNFQTLSTSVNSYAQVLIQNTSTGTAASSDFIVSNNLTTSSTYYGDLGMNGSNFSGTGSLSLPNAVYLYSANGELVLGTYTANGVRIVTNNASGDALYVDTTGKVSVNSNISTIKNINSAFGTIFDNGAVVSNGTYTLLYKAPVGFNITAIDAVSATGSFTLAIQIAGVNVVWTGGGTTISVTSSPTTTTALSSNSVVAGQMITAVITSASGSPTGSIINLDVTTT